ncbi:telomere repeats-binding bouquet formation protein 2 isoform X2 [Oxyura jamaicensis]|uniref:telomere repeats-binding bouquet formation protein 2 isoform X2 n=1 Tax=Oxyura jamaicensis TaxID=8884 RepID=UPI0015A54D23|nr:telomere repeats-binding bouquet formation protein 2 isoform X2 [Oxyura jamaicensis]
MSWGVWVHTGLPPIILTPVLPPAVAGGGLLTRWQDADYLFSSDAAHPDTLRIHESLEYLDGRATVFHSCYLSAWANTSAEMKESVVLGHFVLPPACLQEEIRRKTGGFIWEQMDDSLAEKRHNEELQANEDLPDEAEMVREVCKQDVREDVLNLSESSEENPGSRASTRGEFSYHALKEYPMNNMVTGYTSARDMKKYVGELRDFIPGTSGYTAYWIQNEIKVYSDVKTKMKRKL